jgi:hypothetical protein
MMNSLIPVKEHPSLLRDKNSKALINTDIAALNEYKNKKKMAEDVDTLKKEIQELKQLMLLVVDSIKKDK